MTFLVRSPNGHPCPLQRTIAIFQILTDNGVHKRPKNTIFIVNELLTVIRDRFSEKNGKIGF